MCFQCTSIWWREISLGGVAIEITRDIALSMDIGTKESMMTLTYSRDVCMVF